MLKRIKAWHVVLFIICCLLLYNVPIQYNIEKTMPAVYWSKDDTSILEHTDIAIEGTLKYYLFKDNVFNGYVKIKGKNSTYREDAVMYSNVIDGRMVLGYTLLPPEDKEFLMMFCSQDLSNILIACKDEDGDASGKPMTFSHTISAPASSREEAVQVAKSVVKPSKAVKAIDWR